MKAKQINPVDLAGAGQKLLAHSKSAEFTARRGLAIEMFPFIYGASLRMSSPAISQFLEAELGIKLSSVTINKTLKDPHKSWNLFFDEIEHSARVFVEDDGALNLKDFLFQEQYFWKPIKNSVLQAAMKAIVSAKIAHAISILRTKWFSIDWETRLKARPYLEHRLGGKGEK